jgi:serine/threonine-protein kinase
VRVFDFGWTTRGDPFLVMELAQGETLSSVLHRETRIGAIRAVQLLLPICDGIRCAHEKGIVHRDIKPENVFLAADPFGRLQPKLLDFGIAKMDQQDARLTQVGAVLGSPEFMSPEQARGDQDIDLRTDVWSMAVMLYELVTGVLPFKHSNYNALMQTILNDKPKPTTESNAGDPDLWRVINKGLTKNRDERWQSMTEFGEALALWLYEHGVKEDVCGNSVRALWLDGSLSGVRFEVSTQSSRLDKGDSDPNSVETVLSNPTLVQQLRARARYLAQVGARRAASLGLGVLGVAAGVALTLALTKSSEPRALESTSSEPSRPHAKTTRPTPAPEQTLAAVSLEKIPPLANSAKNDETAPLPSLSPQNGSKPRAPAKTRTALAASEPKPAPRRHAPAQPKTIRDFGF